MTLRRTDEGPMSYRPTPIADSLDYTREPWPEDSPIGLEYQAAAEAMRNLDLLAEPFAARTARLEECKRLVKNAHPDSDFVEIAAAKCEIEVLEKFFRDNAARLDNIVQDRDATLRSMERRRAEYHALLVQLRRIERGDREYDDKGDPITVEAVAKKLEGYVRPRSEK